MVNAWEERVDVSGFPGEGQSKSSSCSTVAIVRRGRKWANFPIFLNRATIVHNRIMRMSIPVRRCPCCCQESS